MAALAQLPVQLVLIDGLGRTMQPFRLALFLIDRSNDYQAQLQQDFEQTTRRLDLQGVVFSADNKADTQASQLRACINDRDGARPRALLVCPVSEIAVMPLVHDAARAGLAWVMLSRWSESIPELRRQYPNHPIFAVVPDHVEIGRVQGRQARILLAPGDELVYIQGPMSTYSTRKRCYGLEKELEGKSDFRWSRLHADWSEAGGENAMRSWLSTFTTGRLPEFVIAAQNDAMAAGARQAVLDWASEGGRLCRSELRVLGCDGSPTFGQRLVTAGHLRATVVIPPLAGRAVEEVSAAIRFKKQPDAETTVGVRSFPELDSIELASRRLR